MAPSSLPKFLHSNTLRWVCAAVARHGQGLDPLAAVVVVVGRANADQARLAQSILALRAHNCNVFKLA